MAIIPPPERHAVAVADAGSGHGADAPDSGLRFLREAGRLKDTLRSAHTEVGRRESAAEHSWRLCLWLVALDEREGEPR